MTCQFRAIRIQLSSAKGWRMPENTVNVARGPGRKWGNPFKVGHSYPIYEDDLCTKSDGETGPLTAKQAVDAFRDEAERLGFLQEIDELRGKNLACWCPLDAPCHADVLIELANEDGG